MNGILSFGYPSLDIRRSSTDLYIEAEYDSSSDVNIQANNNIYLEADDVLELTAYDLVDIYSDDDMYLQAYDELQLFSNTDTIELTSDAQGVGGNCVLSSLGDWECTGDKRAYFSIDTGEGIKKYHVTAVEGTKSWFIDEGTDRLEKGEKTIVLDKQFQLVISNQTNVRAFVTPKGKCNLYVTDETWNSFKVVGWDGPEKEDCEFNWRVDAVRMGFEEIDMDNDQRATNIDELLKERYNLLFD